VELVNEGFCAPSNYVVVEDAEAFDLAVGLRAGRDFVGSGWLMPKFSRKHGPSKREMGLHSGLLREPRNSAPRLSDMIFQPTTKPVGDV